MNQISVGQNFDIKKIAESGQCFRMTPLVVDGKLGYRTIYKNNYIELFQDEVKSNLYVSCSEVRFKEVWEEYFDMKTDYDEMGNKIVELGYEYITSAYEFSKGIRILRQEPFEALISFIISQQKRIPNIMETVENLCNLCGTSITDEFTGKTFKTFPDTNTILSVKDRLGELKLGYRDEYIIDACMRVTNLGIDWFTVDAYNRALLIYGVGKKVANCYALYGCHELQRFPIDTWINKILLREYPNGLYLKDCTPFGGVIQQYMFYYERNK